MESDNVLSSNSFWYSPTKLFTREKYQKGKNKTSGFYHIKTLWFILFCHVGGNQELIACMSASWDPEQTFPQHLLWEC